MLLMMRLPRNGSSVAIQAYPLPNGKDLPHIRNTPQAVGFGHLLSAKLQFMANFFTLYLAVEVKWMLALAQSGILVCGRKEQLSRPSIDGCGCRCAWCIGIYRYVSGRTGVCLDMFMWMWINFIIYTYTTMEYFAVFIRSSSLHLMKMTKSKR